MPITNHTEWTNWVERNKEPYGKCCVEVARKVMEFMDEEPGPLNVRELISRSDAVIDGGGITGFMAGAVAAMVSCCHSRGKSLESCGTLKLK